MNTLRKTLVLLTSVFCITVGEDGDERNKKIDELEREKSELLKQINFAIDDSVKSLLKANDTEADLGLEYMKDLKEHMKELNKSEPEVNVDSKSDLENRRHLKAVKYFKKLKEPKDDFFNFDKILKPKRMSAAEWQVMIANRIKMQQKLDMWITERQKEKDRMKKWKMQKQKMTTTGKYEKCPRFGYHGIMRREKKKGKDRIRPCTIMYNASIGKDQDKCFGISEVLQNGREEQIKRRRQQKLRNKYPCCRKCCKKSYMGCL